RVLAQRLGEELRALGLQEVQVRENAIVTATLPANCDRPLPTVAFFAHLDTSAEQSADTHAQVLPYHGGDLCLNAERQIFLRQSAFP
ncbi:MAG: peptidase T, partial [Edwardsiella sp. (in: enterobacteria)]